MKQKFFFIGLSFFFAKFLFAQSITVNLAAGIDTLNNQNIRNIFYLWNNYLNSNPDSIYYNLFWNKKEENEYKNFDLLNSSGFLNPSLYALVKGYNNIILSITAKGDFYIIRSMFYYTYPNKTIYPLAIIKVLAKKEGQKFKLANYISYATSGWLTKTDGYFKYIYFPDFPFDKLKAKESNDFYKKVCDIMGLPPDTFTYYIAPDCMGIRKIQGFDYVVGMGGENNLCGFYDSHNNIIYSNCKRGELDKHEILHYILRKYPNSGIFHLGLVGYWGDSFDKDINYQIKRVNSYLQKHPEINLNDFVKFNKVDEYTNPQYVIPAIFCHLALEQGGIEKLKKLFQYGNTYLAIEKEFGIKQSQLNKFIRKKIQFYSRNGMKVIEP